MVVEQIIRPTGLIDPPIDVRPVKGQVDDLLQEIRARVARGERVLVTTLTKRMAEDLTQYYQELGVRVRYLHSDIDTLERVEILRDLRRGEFDVLVGINLLREGLDLPEVSLVAILDADKEGFLRSAGSLIQTSGRAARNVNGRVIMYADKMTDSMRMAIGETDRRRAHPGGLQRGARHHAAVDRQGDRRGDVERLRARLPDAGGHHRRHRARSTTSSSSTRTSTKLQEQMKAAAANLDFEKAAVAPRRHQTAAQSRAGLAAAGAEGVTAACCRSSNDWLKQAALEVQEYVLPGRAAAVAACSPPPLYRHDIVEQFDVIGVGSLTVVLLTGFFTGAALALQSGLTLDQFGARPVVGRLVSASMIKELGPVLTGADADRPRRLGHRRRARVDGGHRSDQRAARARHRSDPQAGRAARARRLPDGAGADHHLRLRRHRRRLDRGAVSSCRSPAASTGRRSRRRSTCRTSGWGSSSRSCSGS